MDDESKDAVTGADVPRHQDPDGSEPICAATQPYNKYWGWRAVKGRALLYLLGLLAAGTLYGLVQLADHFLFPG